MIYDFDIAVVGSGPAGTSAAWALHKLDPALAEKAVILEMGSHPRKKVCAGCITGRGDRKGVVEGKRVDLGGRRIIKKKR